MRTMRRTDLLPKVLLVLLSFALFFMAMILLLRLIGLENVHQIVQNAGIWAPLLFIILCSFSLIIAPLSGSSLFIVGGALFGKENGFFLSLIASILGCSINFWIAKKLGRTVVLRLIGRNNFKQLDKFTGQVKGNRGIVYLTLIMLLSQDLLSYAAGLTPISYRRFLVALLLSGTVAVSTYIYLGSSLLEALV